MFDVDNRNTLISGITRVKAQLIHDFLYNELIRNPAKRKARQYLRFP